MVKYKDHNLDMTFSALADPTRRHILAMLIEKKQRRIKDLSEPFDISMAGISKHIKVLEKADLVHRYKRGREYYLELNPAPLQSAREMIEFYEKFWSERFDCLEQLLQKD